jgi:hypothetical protein
MNNSGMDELEAEFDRKMLWICDECKRLFGYRPARFQAMVSEMVGRFAAKTLLAPEPERRSVAWTELQRSQGTYFHLTMEYCVVQDRYRELFSQAEIRETEMRLAWFPAERVDRNFYRNPE